MIQRATQRKPEDTVFEWGNQTWTVDEIKKELTKNARNPKNPKYPEDAEVLGDGECQREAFQYDTSWS